MLYLLPNLLDASSDPALFFPPKLDEIVAKLDGLIAESESKGRAFLKKFQCKKKPHEIPIALLNRHTNPKDYNFLLEPIVNSETWGLISDAGLPCIADPGSTFVDLANKKGVKIEAISGPSSIILALMLSGLPGQCFTFRGYIAQEPRERQKELRAWEQVSKKEKSTQIFIEAPYRNLHTLKTCLTILQPDTVLSVAAGLASQEQLVITKSIREWSRMQEPKLQKIPTVFLFS